MIDGILIVDKQEGITSYDVIRKLKRVFEKGQKIGHAGTLDPIATGLLIILLGKATKLMNTIHSYEKVYEVEGEFGYATDTQDRQGVVTNRDLGMKKFSKEEIDQVIEKHLLGQISQMPPNYSAKKIHGQRAYDLAREGKEVALKPVDINVSSFEIYEYDYPKFKCMIKCSTGTYVRTLIYDLGIRLNTYATTKELRRISVGNFNVTEAISSTQLREENRESILRRVINI